MTENANDAFIQTRLEFIASVLKERYNTKATSIKALAYEENFPFNYNNFVYDVTVESSHLQDFLDKQHGTQATPEGVNRIAFRLVNSAGENHHKLRVENEVCIMTLARQALEVKNISHLIPQVYAWGSAANGQQGYTIQEFMPGKTISADFATIARETKLSIMAQMAEAFCCLQKFVLPDTIKGYGGLVFDTDGAIKSGGTTPFAAGEYLTYGPFVEAMIRSNLVKADADPTIQGWRENQVKDRLERFFEAPSGFKALVEKTSGKKMTITHSDFTTDNILYDEKTGKITAILDFDFSYIGTNADDFLRSLEYGSTKFVGSRDAEPELLSLQEAMLHAFPDPLPENSDSVNWALAKAWDDWLKDVGLPRPSTLEGISELADLYWLDGQLLPFRVCHPVVVKKNSPEVLMRRKKEYEKGLSKFLADYGF